MSNIHSGLIKTKSYVQFINFFVNEMLSPTTFTELDSGSQNSSGHKMFENTSLNISYYYKCPACSDCIKWTISFLIFTTQKNNVLVLDFEIDLLFLCTR